MTENTISLRSDKPIHNSEVSEKADISWGCNIWEKRKGKGHWPLFATAWGKTRTEAMAKANFIIQACGDAT